MFHPQDVRDLVGSMQNLVLMKSTHVLAHRWYVISLNQCRIVCSWDLSVYRPQIVRDFVGSMQNRVLMGSPCFSPTEST